MKASDYYTYLDKHIDFTKLTDTGISNNLEKVFEFAEDYCNMKNKLDLIPQRKSIENAPIFKDWLNKYFENPTKKVMYKQKNKNIYFSECDLYQKYKKAMTN